MKKPIAAKKDTSCNELKPVIACPDVHPPAYLVPKPIRNPPIIINIMPFGVERNSKLNSSDGCKPEKSVRLNLSKERIVSFDIWTE